MKRLLIIGSVILVLGSGIWAFLNWDEKISQFLKDSPGELALITEEVKDSIENRNFTISFSTPPPLRLPTPDSSEHSQLSVEGIYTWTNTQRTQHNQAPLSLNEKLSQAAEAKVDDMFEQQYFEHVSPQGRDAGDLAQNAQYAFLSIGENLALGGFENDETLVQAWMDSPGHRENILDASFQEIGIAAKKGTFEGKPTWLAVQIFGLPQSACPQPSPSLLEQIHANQAQLDEWESQLAEQSANIDAGRATSRDIQEHNTLVRRYNILGRETKELISQYNSQITDFNTCIER